MIRGALFDEAIAKAVNGNDVPRLGWVRFDLLTQPGDTIVNRARDRAADIAPNFVEQLIARDDFTSTRDQVAQDLKFAS